jgi:hypothetical protein
MTGNSRLVAAKAFNTLSITIPSEAHVIPNEEVLHDGEKLFAAQLLAVMLNVDNMPTTIKSSFRHAS